MLDFFRFDGLLIVIITVVFYEIKVHQLLKALEETKEEIKEEVDELEK